MNTISPGIIFTPFAKEEFAGPRGPGYRRKVELSAAGLVGTPDEVANVAALLMGPEGGFITGSDFPMDGGVTLIELEYARKLLTTPPTSPPSRSHLINSIAAICALRTSH